MDDSKMKWCCNCKSFFYLAYDNMRSVCIRKKDKNHFYKSAKWKGFCVNFSPSENYKGDWQVSLFE